MKRALLTVALVGLLIGALFVAPALAWTWWPVRTTTTTVTTTTTLADPLSDRVTVLEGQVADLESRVAALEGPATTLSTTTTTAPTTTTLAPTTTTLAPTTTTVVADALNVRDYGAKGDGVTNDRAAIQACINAAASQSKGVYFPTPADAYRIVALSGTGLTIPSNSTLRGDGAASVIEMYDAGTDARHVLVHMGAKTNITLQDLTLTGTQTNKQASVQNCWCSAASNITFRNVTWGGCEYAIRCTGSGGSTWANGIYVYDCTTLTSVLNPFYLAYCNDFYLDGGEYEANRVDCIPTRWPHHFYVSGYTSNLTVKNATFTGGQHAMMTIDGPSLTNVLFQNIIIEDLYQGIVFYNYGAGPIVFDGVTASTSRMGASNLEWFRFAYGDTGAANITIKNFAITGDPSKNDYLCRVYGSAGANCLFQNGVMTSCATSGTNPAGTYVESGSTAPAYDNVTINGQRYDT